MPWRPKSTEHFLLQAYSRREQARIFADVPMAGDTSPGIAAWEGAAARRLDGVLFPSLKGTAAIVAYADQGRSECDALLPVEAGWVIEAKRKLNRGVIGQLVAGRAMYGKQFGRAPARTVALCIKADPALAWVCGELGIEVVVVPDEEVQQLRAAVADAGGAPARSAREGKGRKGKGARGKRGKGKKGKGARGKKGKGKKGKKTRGGDEAAAAEGVARAGKGQRGQAKRGKKGKGGRAKGGRAKGARDQDKKGKAGGRASR